MISNVAAATLAGKVTFPELSPSIQVVVVDPSYPAIFNCLEPVAEPASAVTIIMFQEPVVILSPAV